MRGKGFSLNAKSCHLLCDAPIQPEYLYWVFLRLPTKRGDYFLIF